MTGTVCIAVRAIDAMKAPTQPVIALFVASGFPSCIGRVCRGVAGRIAETIFLRGIPMADEWDAKARGFLNWNYTDDEIAANIATSLREAEQRGIERALRAASAARQNIRRDDRPETAADIMLEAIRALIAVASARNEAKEE